MEEVLPHFFNASLCDMLAMFDLQNISFFVALLTIPTIYQPSGVVKA